MEFLLALQFLTRIPVSIRGTVTEQRIARSMAYYPLVGLVLGGAAALLYFLLSNLVAGIVADLAVVALLVIITGNMHLDGLMDTADGIGSGKGRDKMLDIMRDSRVGSHGVIAGVLVLFAKVILLAQINPEYKVTAILIFPVLARWSMVYTATIYNYARAQGLGSFTAYLGKGELFMASAFTLAVTFYFLRLDGFIVAAVVLAGVVLLGAYLVRRVGGMTGDLFGAVNETIEVLSLFVLTVMLQ